MTSYMKYPNSISRFIGVAVCAVMLAGLLPRAVVDVYAVAPEIRIDTINGLPPTSYSCPESPLSNPVVVMGSGQGTAPPGRIEQYGVQIDWGDGSPIEVASSVFTPPSGRGDFTYTYQTPAHTYPNGSFTLTLALFHTQPGGNDNQIDSTVTFQVCTFNPVTPTIQLDLINGDAPGSFSCPDNPVENPVVVSGSGQGAAVAAAIEDFSVMIDWGDGTAKELTIADFTPASGSGVNFTYEFDSMDHSYAAGGNYNVTISLEYPNPGGPGNLVAASQTFSICAFTPVASSLQIDLVNGQDPSTLSCPGSPLSNPVVIAGSGQAPAPPGSVEDYVISMNWGDGSADELATATFNPLSGTLVNFSFTFESLGHDYAASGAYTVTASLVYMDPSAGDQVVASETLDVCVALPTGIVTGEVFDGSSGYAIFGATVEDITDQQVRVGTSNSVIGTFSGGSTYVLKSPVNPSLRTIRVRAQGWEDGIAQVEVVEDQVTTLDFVLTRLTTLNVAIVTLPVGKAGLKLFLIPECVEAIDTNGNIVQTVCTHAGPFYYFIGLPNGITTFRGKNVFYNIGSDTRDLKNATSGTRDQNPEYQVKLPVSLPDELPSTGTRAVSTGGVSGITSDGTSPVVTSVYADFQFNGSTATVFVDSNTSGVYSIDLLPAGQEVTVYAHASGTSDRSVDTPVVILGGAFSPVNLTVLPYDPFTENFVPYIEGPAEIVSDEDVTVPLTLGDFDVIDLDDSSAEFVLEIGEGFHYSRSNVQSTSVEVVPDPNYNGIISVPVRIGDGTNLSAPLDLFIDVNAVPDPTVYVNFDTGQTGTSARGTAESPFRTVGAALSVVSPGGTIFIGGLTTSNEPLFTINQSVTLVNNNPGGEVVTIDPSAAADPAAVKSQTGFVSESSTKP